MFVAIEAEVFCPRCDHPVRVIMTGQAQVNKRSLRVAGPLLGALEHHDCPACGRALRGGDELRRTPYKLAGKDAEAVREYRLRKWGVDEPAELLEVLEAGH